MAEAATAFAERTEAEALSVAVTANSVAPAIYRFTGEKNWFTGEKNWKNASARSVAASNG